EAQLATELSDLARQFVEIINERRSFIQELERLLGNLLAYKTRELKGLQGVDLTKAMEMRKVALQLRLQAHDHPSSSHTCSWLTLSFIDSVPLSKSKALMPNVRIIPGPVGVVQTAKLHKIADTQEGGEESVMSTQEYIRKVIEDVGEDDDFTHASWLSMLDYVNVDGGIVTGCFGDVKKFLKNGKLGKVVAVIKSFTPNALGDLTVTLKDLSGTISGTIHYKVLTEERFAKAITVGSALILHNVSIFSPMQSTHHYLNITKKNMVKVFHKDGGLHSFYALNVAKSIC
ncbi:hypothetical protein Tco_0965039, partial [Tanacetum coccineum]